MDNRWAFEDLAGLGVAWVLGLVTSLAAATEGNELLVPVLEPVSAAE